MNTDVERAAVRLLAERAAPSLSLRELHAMLVAEVGPGVGSYARFRAELDRRVDVFAIVSPDDPLRGAEWPGTLLHEYQGALREAGVDIEPRVVLARARTQRPGGARAAETRVHPAVEPAPGLFGQLGASLLALLDRAASDPALEHVLGSAMADAPVLARAVEGCAAAGPHAAPVPER